jgi:putative peptidoglycan lipid II flippase
VSRAVRAAALLYAASVLLSRVIGLVREGVIGRVLGDSGEADVYWVAFILPDFLNYLLAGGALSLVMIPLLQAARRGAGGATTSGGGADADADADAEEWACFWRISLPVTLLTLTLTALAWAGADHLSPLLAPGFNPEQRALLTHLTRVILPAQVFHLCGAALSAKLQAHDRHLAPALAPLVYAGSVTLCGLLLGERLGAEAFAWGVLIGSALGPFGCPLAALLRGGEGGAMRVTLRQLARGWEPRHPEVRAYITRALPVMLGLSVVALDELIVKRLGTSLEQGAVAQLHYARTLMRLPMAAFGLAIGLAAFPTLARLHAAGAREEVWALLRRSLEAVVLLAALSQVALSAAGAELAALVWGRVRLSDLALHSIGEYCAGLSVGLWAWAAQGLVARGFYAQGKTWLPTLIGTAVTLAALPLYALAAQSGALALTYASSAAISAYVVALWVWVGRDLAGAGGARGAWRALGELVSIGWRGVGVVGAGVWGGAWLTRQLSARCGADLGLEGAFGMGGVGGLLIAAALKVGVALSLALIAAYALRAPGLSLLWRARREA